jgi:hypothetical protein
MTFRSKTTFASRMRANAPFAAGELVLALLDRHDFARAQSIIEGFDRWLSFDDYVCERDGLYIGMSCAGHDAQLASISIRSFERWILHSGVAASIQELDEFAARVHAFRLHPNLPIEGIPAVDWKSSGREIRPREGRFTIPIAETLYEEWLGTLSHLDIFTQAPSVDLYARILLESWADDCHPTD